jgi:MFS family permease
MVEALHFSEVVTPASLALFSVAQAAGRVATGSLSEAALNWNTKSCCIDNGVPRPFFLMAASFVAILAHTILAICESQYLFVLGIMLSGVAFGMVWPLMVLIVGEVFGTANVAANYMFFDGFTSAAGTLLLSKIVAQQVYESHVDPHYSEHSDGVTCYGPECFRMTHIIIVLLSFTCVGSAAAMLYTSQQSYNKSSLHRR